MCQRRPFKWLKKRGKGDNGDLSKGRCRLKDYGMGGNFTLRDPTPLEKRGERRASQLGGEPFRGQPGGGVSPPECVSARSPGDP